MEVGAGINAIMPWGGGALFQIQALINYWLAPTLYAGAMVGVTRFSLEFPSAGIAAGARLFAAGIEIRPQLQVQRHFRRYGEDFNAIGFLVGMPLVYSGRDR